MCVVDVKRALVSMERSGKMQITHENGIEKTATVQKLWPKKIYTEIRAIFLCILAKNFNELEGPLRMLRFVSNFFW